MDLQRGRPRTLYLVPGAPMGEPRAQVWDREQVLRSTPTATPSSFAATVLAGANTRQRILPSSFDGYRAGLSVLISDPTFGSARAVISGREDDTLRLVEALPSVPAEGSTIVGLDVAIELPAFDAYELGLVVELEDLAAPSAETVREDLNVVRYPYLGPCRADHVRDLVQRSYSGERALLGDTELQERIAREVNAQIQARLLSSAEYASTYWSPATLQPARAPMLRLVLAEQYQMREAGADPNTYLQSLRFEVRDRIADVLKGVALKDPNNDGKATPAEGRQNVVKVVR